MKTTFHHRFEGNLIELAQLQGLVHSERYQPKWTISNGRLNFHLFIPISKSWKYFQFKFKHDMQGGFDLVFEHSFHPIECDIPVVQ